MGQILIRRLDDKVIAALKERAARENASVEATARDILSKSVLTDREVLFRRIREIRESQTRPARGPDVVTLIRRMRRGQLRG